MTRYTDTEWERVATSKLLHALRKNNIPFTCKYKYLEEFMPDEERIDHQDLFVALMSCLEEELRKVKRPHTGYQIFSEHGIFNLIEEDKT